MNTEKPHSSNDTIFCKKKNTRAGRFGRQFFFSKPRLHYKYRTLLTETKGQQEREGNVKRDKIHEQSDEHTWFNKPVSAKTYLEKQTKNIQ